MLSRATAAEILSDARALIAESNAVVRDVMRVTEPTWETVIQPLEEIFERQQRGCGRVGALQSVQSTPARQQLVEAIDRLVNTQTTWYGRQRKLFLVILKLRQSRIFATYTLAQQRTIELYLRNFRLLGIDLPPAKQRRLGMLRKEMDQYTSHFSRNILSATQRSVVLVADPTRIEGIPESVVRSAKKRAKSLKNAGWAFTVQSPEYGQVMAMAKDRSLRRELFTLSNQRASDLGPTKENNLPLINRLMTARRMSARISGQPSFAAWSTSFKMSKTPTAVRQLLLRLVRASAPQAQREWEAMQQFARSIGYTTVESWDVDTITEQWRKKEFGLEMEKLRTHFPFSAVWAEMLTTVKKVTGLHFRLVPGFLSYDPSVREYSVTGPDGQARGKLIIDIHARPDKQGGAWVGSDTGRGMVAGTLQLPIVRYVTNLLPPDADGETWLTPDEIVTVFHEMGHAIHHFMTDISIHAVSELGGVEWDAVEIPSQWFEQYGDDPETLRKIARRARRPLRASTISELKRWRTWLGGIRMLRQIRFALFDMEMHDRSRSQPLRTWHKIARRYPFPPIRSDSRFPCLFSHIFSGGYASGYYSYLWSEVYSQYVYQEGLRSSDFLKKFRQQVLARGGERPASDVYASLVGRTPSLKPLLRAYGISA